MASIFRLLMLVLCLSYGYAQKFEEESRYLNLRWLDLSLAQWKPDMLDKLEKTLDAELKYTDERKGTTCQSIDFQLEEGYPKADGRFLDTSIRGICRDEYGTIHDIPKELIIVAIERNVDEVKKATGAPIYQAGNVPLYKRDNLFNWIIIPISVGIIVFLFVLTFVLRYIRDRQKRRHIIEELKKKDATTKKTGTIPNPDPLANENQRLLQLDPNIVGNASNTLGSPKELTNDSNSSSTRANPNVTGTNRTTNNNRSQAPYQNEPPFPYDPQNPDMIPMQEQQPRVVVRTIRNDENPSTYYNQQYPDPSARFVPIPVQVERSGPEQRFVPPPYHSDPYYRQNNV